ncbi:unnamed protein product [Penicillium egyptiacum]|uniref:Alcohol dehydrogenase-like N-terminal domain-containing protein n=1 Tax=Penicillium egyptiacum TaxID=1303716 RepID=A0A9W4KGN3_9EURO|nr:unnamed protein product [Penicillium egyptiacum]
MAQHPENQAAWLTASKATPLEVGPAPYTPPGPGQLVVPVPRRRHPPSHPLPTIFGEDVSGTVIAIGEGVTRFRVGDRVLTMAGLIPSNNTPEGAFQLLHRPLIVAGLGLFGKDYLGLDLPTVPARPADGSRVVIIAGGASSVGGTAVQLAAAAGYEIVSTSSPKNFDLVKSLGAAHVVDYNSPTVGDELLAVRGRQLFIARAEGKHSVEEGGEVEVKFILVSPEVIGAETPLRPIFEEYLPRALVERQFVPRPKPEVVGTGLDKIQDALEVLRKGVSAKKIIMQL